MCQLPHKTAGGFVLPFILMMIQVIMLYGLSGVLLNQVLIKEKSDVMITRRDDQVMASILASIEQTIELDHLSCQMPLRSWRESKRYPIGWWRENGCEIVNKNKLYYFFVEVMGDDPCALINGKDVNIVASYYRVSIAALSDLLNGFAPLVQATLVLPVKRLKACDLYLHSVDAGQQMIRRL